MSYVLILRFILRLVTFLLPEAYLERIDKLVELGRFQSRSELVREAVKEIIEEELKWCKRGETHYKIPIALSARGDSGE